MAKRFQSKQYQFIFKFIAARDGEYCINCKSTGSKRYPLEIDHMNADPTDPDPENLHILCKKCNLLKRGLTVREQIKMIKKDCAVNERERERERGAPGTGTARAMVDYTGGSKEMQANDQFELKFRDWVLEHVKKHGVLAKSDAIHGGAEIVGCSSVTTARYLQKMTSISGVLEESKHGTGISVIQYRS